MSKLEPGNPAPNSPEVTVRVELASWLGTLVQENRGLAEQVEQQIGHGLVELLATLGIPGRPAVEISSSDIDGDADSSFMRILVNGQRCRFPPVYLIRVFCYLNGSLPQPTHNFAEISGWLKQGVATQEKGAEPNRDQAGQFLTMATLEIVKSQPQKLMGLTQLVAYRSRLVNAASSKMTTEEFNWLSEIFPTPLKVKISLSRLDIVGKLLLDGWAEGRSAADTAEDLIAELCSSVIEVRLPGNYLDSIMAISSVNLHKQLADLRELLFNELGIRFPAIRFIGTEGLKPYSFSVKVNDLTLLPHVGLPPDERIVFGNPDALQRYKTQNSTIIVDGVECAVIDGRNEETVRSAGVYVLDPFTYLWLTLCSDLRENAACCLTRDHVEEQMSRLGGTYPDLVEAVSAKTPLEQMARCLRALLAERVSVRDLRLIFERVLDYDYVPVNAADNVVFDDRLAYSGSQVNSWLADSVNLTSFIRRGMKEYFANKLQGARPKVVFYRLPVLIEQLVAKLSENPSGTARELSEHLRELIVVSARSVITQLPPTARPVLLTLGHIRPLVSEVLAQEFDDITVLAMEELPADLVDYYLRVGDGLWSARDYFTAVSAYTDAILLAPEWRVESALLPAESDSSYSAVDYPRYYILGSWCYGRDKMLEALEAFRQATKREPQSAPAHHNLANCYYSLQRSEEAIREWQEALRIDPNLVDAQYNLGIAFWTTGDEKKAIEAWKQASQSAADFVPARENLAAANAERPPNLTIRGLL